MNITTNTIDERFEHANREIDRVRYVLFAEEYMSDKVTVNVAEAENCINRLNNLMDSPNFLSSLYLFCRKYHMSMIPLSLVNQPIESDKDQRLIAAQIMDIMRERYFSTELEWDLLRHPEQHTWMIGVHYIGDLS